MMRGVSERPVGLDFRLEAIGEALEREAIAAICALDLRPMVLHDTPSKRLVAHFGVRYDPDTRTVGRAAPAIPPILAEVVDAAAAALGVGDLRFDEVLATRYPPGAGIGRHTDATGFGAVLGVSLLNICDLQFERGSGTSRRVWEQFLPPRSAYLLRDAARWRWRHGISAVRRERLSVTAREVLPPACPVRTVVPERG